MAFWNPESLQLEEFRSGILSKAEMGENLIMAYMQIEAGEEDSGHSHNFDQCGVVLEGRLEMFIGGDRQLLKKNDCYFIPSGAYHGWKTFDEPVRILDVSAKQVIE